MLFLVFEVLTVLRIGFCHTGPPLLCIDLFVCICEHGGVDLMGLKLNA